MKKQRRRRGMSMALVLMVAAVVLTLAFSLAALSAAQVNLGRQFESDRAAQALAEGLVAQAMALLNQNSTYGKDRTETLRTPPDPQDPSRYAALTFAIQPGQPYCTSNWDGNSPVGYGNADVPPGSTHLWVEGHAGGLVRAVEVMVSVPQSPFALQTNGSLTFGSGLLVEGATDLESAVALAQQQSTTHTAASMGAAVQISGQAPCIVTGNVDSPGTTDLPEGSQVDGTMRTDPLDVPAIDPSQYDPSGQSDAVAIQGTTLTNPQPITQRMYTSGGLTVHGNLVLQNGMLYVPGDLVVQGTVSGHGLVAVTGSVQISGNTALSGSVQETALVAGGDVTLTGNFVGMLSSEGLLSATNGALIGSFMASGPHSAIQVDKVTAIYVPDAAQFLLNSMPGAQEEPQWVQSNSVLAGGMPGFTLQLGLSPTNDAVTVLSAVQQAVAGKSFAFGNLPLHAGDALPVSDPRLYHALPLSMTNTVDLTTATSLLHMPGQPIQRVMVQTAPAFQWSGNGWSATVNSGWSVASQQPVFANPRVTVDGERPLSLVTLDINLEQYNHTTVAGMVAALYRAQQAVTQMLQPQTFNSSCNSNAVNGGNSWSYNMNQAQFTHNPTPLGITSWRDH